MPTTLTEEQSEQRRWKLRPEWSKLTWHDQLVAREFLSPEEEQARQTGALGRIVAFAAEAVPYYQTLFKRLGITADKIRGPADLPTLPALLRGDVQEHHAALRARHLPEGERVVSRTKTSGSTGQPVEVVHTARSKRMFVLLKQRQLRWARFDPMGRYGMIRPPHDMPPNDAGAPLEPGQTFRRDNWSPQVGPYFETGPLLGYSTRNPLEDQMDWLQEQRLDYLLGQSAELEHLALGFQERRPLEGLRGILSITHQLTPEMQHRIERTFKAPVHENYGFNEIGIVASRCREGGRYHVNTEHCLVEVADDEGRPCKPGETGHLLATGLTNFAMPLLRYDSGDLVETVEGPCPCGRRLPAFGTIHGRYRRIANLPPETFEFWAAVRRALADMPDELSKPLRQYQMHQYRDGRYELRVVAAGALDQAFGERIRQKWEQTGAPNPPPLAILIVDQIPRPPGGKFQDFTSDFALPPEPGRR